MTIDDWMMAHRDAETGKHPVAILTLANGKKFVIGHVNQEFGRDGCCEPDRWYDREVIASEIVADAETEYVELEFGR